jgi:hypothetical protein
MASNLVTVGLVNNANLYIYSRHPVDNIPANELQTVEESPPAPFRPEVMDHINRGNLVTCMAYFIIRLILEIQK